MKYLKTLSLLAVMWSVPFTASAQVVTLEVIVNRMLTLLNRIIPLLMALAVIGFFWGVAKFVFSAGDAAKRASGLNFMIWGVVGLFVMVSVWGLVAVLQSTFLIGPGGAFIPQFGGF